jgi:hypothetical protein
MNKKIERNTLCPCGSGKKFKKCCMADDRIVVSDMGWQKIRETEGKLVELFLRPWVVSVAPDLIKHAWDDFWFGEADLLPKELHESIAIQLFEDWFLFNWKPHDLKNMRLTEIEEGFPVALQYLQKKGHTLNEYEKRFIKEICQTHFSFYVVIDVTAGKSITLKDIFLKSTVIAKELKASNILKTGDIIFARVLSIDEHSICVGILPMIIPSHFHTELLDIRDTMIGELGKLNANKLAHELDDSMREILLEFLEEMLNPPKPQLHNTDGDPIVLCSLSYSLNCDIEEACKVLLPMALSKKPDDFISGAKRNKKTGMILKIELPWVKRGNQKHTHWETTLLGNITIEKNKIIINTNSENRAKKAEKLIARYLGDKATFLRLKKQTPLQASKQKSKGANKIQSTSTLIPESMPPEVIAKIKEHFHQHWVAWLDLPVPALNNLTPRQSTATEAGRERLEALLLDFERKNINKDSLSKVDVEWLRKKLGLI